jgi:hypothetical protein
MSWRSAVTRLSRQLQVPAKVRAAHAVHFFFTAKSTRSYNSRVCLPQPLLSPRRFG